jgi:hypothetical protein
VALGEKFSQKFDYPTDDPDPEDKNKEILQSFKVPSALTQFLTYEAETKILKCAIPL